MADSKTSVAGLFCHCRQYGGALGVTLMKKNKFILTVLVFALRKSQDLEEFCGVLYSTKPIYFPKQGKFGIQLCYN